MISKFLFRIIVFLVPVIFLIIGIGKFDNKDKYSGLNDNVNSIQQKNEYDSLDILFIGNSYCYAGIIPALFDSVGIRTYNLGIATTGPQFYQLLLDDYTLHTKLIPKTVFISLSPITFTSSSDNFTEYPIHRYLLTPYSNESICAKFDLCSSYPSMLINSFKKGTKNVFANFSQGEKIKAKGYIQSDEVFSPEKHKKHHQLYVPLEKAQFDFGAFNAFIKQMKSYENKGTRVFYFQLPTHLLHAYFSKTFLTDYQNAMVSLEKENKLFTLLLPDSASYFRDIDHLNHTGATAVTNQLIQLISQKAILNNGFTGNSIR